MAALHCLGHALERVLAHLEHIHPQVLDTMLHQGIMNPQRNLTPTPNFVDEKKDGGRMGIAKDERKYGTRNRADILSHIRIGLSSSTRS